MNLYEVLAEAYEEIFPTDPDRVEFCHSLLPPTGGSILDAGCGTGGLLRALARGGHTAVGFDADAAMVAEGHCLAREEDVHVELAVAGMLDLVATAASRRFDLVTCLGNTIVHLNDDEELESFVDQSRTILSPDGVLVVQLLNYDRILTDRPACLPAIETERYRFERDYEYDGDQRVTFTGRLTDRESDRAWTGSTTIRPLRRSDLDGALGGRFQSIRCLADFDGTAATADSTVLTFVARTPRVHPTRRTQ